jgi:hypothetical protein
MGMAWSGIDRNLGLQARVIPACCTGGPHCNEHTTTARMLSCCLRTPVFEAELQLLPLQEAGMALVGLSAPSEQAAHTPFSLVA